VKEEPKMETTKNYSNQNLGRIIKHQRIISGLTLRELSANSGVSSSHLGRIERGERFPSAHVLRRVASYLGFEESELFALAGYFSPSSPTVAKSTVGNSVKQLDPVVSRALAVEPIEVQRATIVILTVLKSIAKSLE
jgi:transcriptional regulator with XRE-family HTH domain